MLLDDSGSVGGVVTVEVLHSPLSDDGVSAAAEPDAARRVVVLPLVAGVASGRVADGRVAEGAVRRQLSVR